MAQGTNRNGRIERDKIMEDRLEDIYSKEEMEIAALNVMIAALAIRLENYVKIPKPIVSMEEVIAKCKKIQIREDKEQMEALLNGFANNVRQQAYRNILNFLDRKE